MHKLIKLRGFFPNNFENVCFLDRLCIKCKIIDHKGKKVEGIPIT